MGAESFGQLLRQYRIAAGFSQEHVAEAARLSVVSISALERGSRQAPYRHTVERIVKALGLDEAQARALEAAAETARRRRPAERPSTPSANGKLPAGTLPLVGRTTDVANIVRLVKANRLVTITGTGGVGKTRVAIEAAAELRQSLGPPAFIDLAPAVSGGAVCGTIASPLMNSSMDSSTIVHQDPETLTRWLGERRLLLILDTCEHVLPDVAETVLAILRSCPGVALLATSRQRLGVSGEVVYRVRPLAVPAGPVGSLREARDHAALDLFIRRAMSSEHGVSFGDGDADAVADICRVLDGIPLSIELAAARVATLGLRALATRLRANWEPPNGNRDAPPRHQTSSASIAWSYRLLSNDEKRLLAQLCVFPGPFTLAAAETACAGGDLDEAGVADALSSLVEKNLIEVTAVGTATAHSLPNALRTFASSRRADSEPGVTGIGPD